MNIWDEFKLIFKNPREIHRVLMIIPLSALMSHILYLGVRAPMGVPLTTDQIITFVLGGFIYFMFSCWVLLSNSNNVELTLRFFYCAVLSILAHRLIVMVDSFGTWYTTTVSLIAIASVMVFVITGKTKNELKVWFSINMGKSKNDSTDNLRVVPDSDHQSNVG